MRRLVIDMQNLLFSDAIVSAINSSNFDFETYISESPYKTFDTLSSVEADILIMEVTKYDPWNIDERMKIRKEVKKKFPKCKIVLVVDENTDKKLSDEVRQAKKDGIIDGFIYGSISTTYLLAVLDAL